MLKGADEISAGGSVAGAASHPSLLGALKVLLQSVEH